MRVVLTGGGTGGHIYPALAIGRQLQAEDPDVELLYIGTEKGLESRIVPGQGLAFAAIEITGFQRKLSLHNVRTVIRFLKGVKRARQLLREFRADAVVGTGGYVCGPVVYAAAKLGIPTLIHEQNVQPGLTNRFLSRYADIVAVSFEASLSQFGQARDVRYTGNPCATQVAGADARQGAASLGLPEKRPLVLVVGGSRGAKALNDASIAMAPRLKELPQAQFVYVTGEAYYEATKTALTQAGKQLPANLKLMPYLHNMPEVLAASSLVISRSGASSLSEITALGVPAILIPSPNVTGNHQEPNARTLADAGAAVMVLERELSGERLFGLVADILQDETRRKQMSAAARARGRTDAAPLIASALREACGNARKR